MSTPQKNWEIPRRHPTSQEEVHHDRVLYYCRRRDAGTWCPGNHIRRSSKIITSSFKHQTHERTNRFKDHTFVSIAAGELGPSESFSLISDEELGSSSKVSKSLSSWIQEEYFKYTVSPLTRPKPILQTRHYSQNSLTASDIRRLAFLNERSSSFLM